MAEEVVTQEAAAQFGQETKDIAHTVHHRQTSQVLLSIKGSRDWQSRNSNLELDIGSGGRAIGFLLFASGLY